MFKLNKKKLLNLAHLSNAPLLPEDSKGDDNKLRIKKVKQRIVLKRNKNINSMEITYGIIRKKIKSLFDVDLNKSTKSCNPCMNVCKKVNNKINGRELSKVNNNEMKELIKVFSS